MRTINKIIIHCTATKEGQDVTAKQVDTWHRQRGWSGIGYHYLVRLDGTIESGRPLEQVGAHTLGQNKYSIGICYAGGLDSKGNSKDTRTDQQKDALINLISDLKERFPSATIHGHREYSNKDCPCFDAKEEYKDIGTVRTSPTQSTTVQASAVTIASGIGTGIGAVGNLDGTAQLILIGFACTIILAGMWILRERLRKWANGDR
jgi:Negative regulator of beta-lactamase expression